MRCADPHATVRQGHARQRGAAIILALLTVVLAAGIAAALVASLGRSIDSASGRQDQAQARILARGAVDWARNVLADDAKSTAVDHLREPWTVQVPPTPVDDGEISGEIQDWSGRFNLNNLAPAGKRDDIARQEFQRLLQALGVSSGQAAQLSLALQQWMAVRGGESGEGGEDSADGSDTGDDAQRGANEAQGSTQGNRRYGALADISELLLVPGFDAEMLARLRPYAAALPAPSSINLNTASSEVLMAITRDLSLDAARVLVAERERIWFRNLGDYQGRLPEGTTPSSPTRLDVRSRYFLATGRARHGKAMVRMEVLLDRKDTWPDILWHRIL